MSATGSVFEWVHRIRTICDHHKSLHSIGYAFEFHLCSFNGWIGSARMNGGEPFSAVLAESLALLSELDEYLNFDYFIPKEEA